VWKAYTGVIHCVLDKIPNLQNCVTTVGGLKQTNTCRQVPVQVIFKKSLHLGFGVFLVIWSMVVRMTRSGGGSAVSSSASASYRPSSFLQGSQRPIPIRIQRKQKNTRVPALVVGPVDGLNPGQGGR
jgi:hypothetical protein